MFGAAHFQNAYVTRDLDAAVAAFGARTGFSGFRCFEVPFEIETPTARGQTVSRLGLGWDGALQYEFIQPVSGLIDFYLDALPAGDGLGFHHAAYRVEDWRAFEAQVAASGLEVVVRGASGEALRFVYLDTRALLGHRTEFVWATLERWAQIRG